MIESECSRRPKIYLIDASTAVTGAFVCASQIAHALAGSVDVVLVVSDRAKLPSELLAAFSKVLRLPIRPLRRSLGSILSYVPALLVSSIALRREMRANDAHTLLVNDFYLMHGTVLRGLGFKGRILTWVRMDPDAFGSIGQLWLKATRSTSNQIIAVSQFIRNLLPPDFRAEVVYDAVRPELEESAPQPHPYPENCEPTFTFVGNFIEGKGQDIAIEALAVIARDFPEARLCLLGGDMGLAKNRAYLNRLRGRVTELGLTEAVAFARPAGDVASRFQNCFAAINLSRSESFSLTVLEASACGLPVIVTRCGGPQEIILDGRTGILVPIDDVQASAAAMTKLLRDREQAKVMGEKGRRHVLDKFSSKAFRTQLQRLLSMD